MDGYRRGPGRDGEQEARRAALRGLAGIAIASATTNLLGKRATRRLRPILAEPILAGADPGGERVLRG